MHDTQVVNQKQYDQLLAEHLKREVDAGRLNYKQITDAIDEQYTDVYYTLNSSNHVDEKVRTRVLTSLSRTYDRSHALRLRSQRIIVETSQFKIATAALQAALAQPSFIVVIGAPGFGKTIAIENFLDCNRSACIAIRWMTHDTALTIAEAITEECGMRINKTGRGRLLRKINHNLVHHNRLIIVDEGDHCSFEDMEMLRDLHDPDASIGKGITSVVVFGNFDLDQTIRLGDRNYMGETKDVTLTTKSQLHRRIKRIYMSDLTTGDVKKFCEAFHFPPASLTDAQAHELTLLLNREGGFGVIDEARKSVARMIARKKLTEKDVDYELMMDTIKQIIAPEGRRYLR